MSGVADLVSLHGGDTIAFHPYVLEGEVGLTEAGELGLEQEVICLVVMKRLNGLLLALPQNTAASEVLQLAQTAGPGEVLGPSAEVEVAAAAWDLASPLTPPTEMDGRRIHILLMDFSNQVADHLKEVADSDLLDVKLFSSDPAVFPLPEAVLDAALAWVHGGAADQRIAFYSADEGPEFVEEPELPATLGQRAKARPPGGTVPGGSQPKPKKKMTVANLAESLDKVVTSLPELASQIQLLTQRTERLERGGSHSLPTSPQHTGGFPMHGLSGTPALGSFLQRMPPPKNTSAQKAPVKIGGQAEQEAEELAQDLAVGESSDLAKALLVQSNALTSLVSHIASSSSDPLQDMTTGAHLVSSRGASGRAKLQQELAAQKGTFFLSAYQQMARRMQPSLPADLSPAELANRGVTASLYLERYGGYGKVRDIGQIAWQVALTMDHMQRGNMKAAMDGLALLLVCLEQTSLDGGNMQVGLMLALTEDPPQTVFSNRSLALGARPRAFAPMADQRWVTTALQYLKELDAINNRRSEVTAPTSRQGNQKEEPAAPKKKPKGKGKQFHKKDQEEED